MATKAQLELQLQQKDREKEALSKEIAALALKIEQLKEIIECKNEEIARLKNASELAQLINDMIDKKLNEHENTYEHSAYDYKY